MTLWRMLGDVCEDDEQVLQTPDLNQMNSFLAHACLPVQLRAGPGQFAVPDARRPGRRQANRAPGTDVLHLNPDTLLLILRLHLLAVRLLARGCGSRCR